jgi:hypothetical protein
MHSLAPPPVLETIQFPSFLPAYGQAMISFRKNRRRKKLVPEIWNLWRDALKNSA